MKFSFPTKTLVDIKKSQKLEWLETNGLGGYACNTLSGMHTRKYHGVLVAAINPPVGRTVLMSKWIETIQTTKGNFELDCNNFSGKIHPKGYEFLKKYEKEYFPTITYQAGGVVLEKQIFMPYGQNTTVIRYTVKECDEDFTLKLKPFVAYRDYHSLTKGNGYLNPDCVYENNILTMQPYLHMCKLFVKIEGAKFDFAPDWYYGFQYDNELERGLEGLEDLFTHGDFYINLSKGQKYDVIISTDDPSEMDAEKLQKAELKRRKALLEGLTYRSDLTDALCLAADQFIVKREPNLKTIIAGYHWFSDWGRDTMISLPGLCLATGRTDDAKKIIEAFARHVSEGMLPNRFPDLGQEPEYNTIDATMWYFVAIYKYFKKTNDKIFVIERMYPILKDIIDWHIRGTRFNIKEEEDGLISAGAHGWQLTWMDAKVGDWVVTPRDGKAVEINALWYNALEIMSEFAKLSGNGYDQKFYEAKAKLTKDAFNDQFVNIKTNTLYDLVNGENKDESIRPNQLIALSLPFELVTKKVAKAVVKESEKHLLTDFGMRSLSNKDVKYIGIYQGGQLSRDGAYHQGTSWSWLLGSYLTAKFRAEGEASVEPIKAFIKNFETHLYQEGIGTVSEIFDGDKPFEPKGCMAQAWGVAEILRVIDEDLKGY